MPSSNRQKTVSGKDTRNPSMTFLTKSNICRNPKQGTAYSKAVGHSLGHSLGDSFGHSSGYCLGHCLGPIDKHFEDIKGALNSWFDASKWLSLYIFRVEKEKQTLVIELDGLSGQLDSISKAKVRTSSSFSFKSVLFECFKVLFFQTLSVWPKTRFSNSCKSVW